MKAEPIPHNADPCVYGHHDYRGGCECTRCGSVDEVRRERLELRAAIAAEIRPVDCLHNTGLLKALEILDRASARAEESEKGE
jgi:hypothetical protein